MRSWTWTAEVATVALEGGFPVHHSDLRSDAQTGPGALNCPPGFAFSGEIEMDESQKDRPVPAVDATVPEAGVFRQEEVFLMPADPRPPGPGPAAKPEGCQESPETDPARQAGG